MRQEIDVRKLNNWLKANVPFWAKCWKSRDGYVIRCDVNNNLHPFVAAIEAEFGVRDIWAYGQTCALTIPYYPRLKG